MKKFLIFIVLLLLAAACGREENRVVIGAKNYSENKLLAEMFVLLAENEGIEVEKYIPYGNTFDLQKGMQEGRIDLYPEYTGTGISLLGMAAPSDPSKSIGMAEEQYKPYDMEWLAPLGFNNTYVLLMEQDAAVKQGIEKISDLAALANGFKIAMHREFQARPVDGFRPLIRRYGIQPQPQPLPYESIKEVYLSLVTDQCPVAVGQKTDPQIEEFNLKILEDDLNFFPAYEAAPLISREKLRSLPRLGDALDKLSGRISAVDMRELNRKVDTYGMDLETVAARFLVEQKLIPAVKETAEKKELIMAIPPAGYRSSLVAKGLNSLRETFPKRKITLEEFSDPVAAVIEGQALVALLGVEHYYDLRQSRLPVIKEKIEAVAPVGYNVVHLIRPRGKLSEYSLDGISRLGVGPDHGSAQKAALFLLDAYNETEQIELVAGNFRDQLKEVAEGGLDAIIALDPVGEASLVLALAENPDLALQPLDKWAGQGRRYRYPFFREIRIPLKAYIGMEQAVETVATQVVLTGPDPEGVTLGSGPASGMKTRIEAIPRRYKERMAEALDFSEPLDPVLPGERLQQVTARLDRLPINPNPGVSAVTAILIILLGILVYALFGRQNPD